MWRPWEVGWDERQVGRVGNDKTNSGYSGYLATMAGLAGGADAAYIHEERFSIQELMRDLDILAFKMDHGNIFRGLILRNEYANKNYDTDFIYRFD